MTQEFEVLRTKRNVLHVFLIAVFIVVGFYVVSQYKAGLLSQEKATFWFAAAFLPVCVFELIASSVTGESYAKGISIYREKSPRLFIVSLLVTLFMTTTCIAGVVVYW